MAEESLIPKKLPPKNFYPSEGVGMFFRLAFILFLLAAFLTGGLYLYKNFATSSLARQKETLQKLEIEFDPKTISELERVSLAISSAREILRAHLHTSEIFDLIEQNILLTVGFNSFSYSADKNLISLNGEAASYADVSLQARVFESLPEVVSATFSNLSLKETTGGGTFAINIALKQ